jgi:hypothetical protein
VRGCNLVRALFLVVVLERSGCGMHLCHSLLRCVCGRKVGARPSITLVFRGGS